MEIDRIYDDGSDVKSNEIYLPRPALHNILSFLIAPKIDRNREKSTIQRVFDDRKEGLYNNMLTGTIMTN